MTNKKIVYHSGPNLRPAYPGDAGFDLVTAEDFKVDSFTYGLVPCEVRVEFPEGVWGWITGRSSTIQKYNLLVLPGVIDSGYRGELFVAVWNMRHEPVEVKKGDRIGQLILMPNVTEQYTPEQVLVINTESARGSRGFGSSGQ